jgi:hypothetical protein
MDLHKFPNYSGIGKLVYQPSAPQIDNEVDPNRTSPPDGTTREVRIGYFPKVQEGPQGEPQVLTHGINFNGFLSGAGEFEGHRLLHDDGFDLPNLAGYQRIALNNASVTIEGTIHTGDLLLENRVTATGRLRHAPGIAYRYQFTVLDGTGWFSNVSGHGVGVGNVLLISTALPPLPAWCNYHHYWMEFEKPGGAP